MSVNTQVFMRQADLLGRNKMFFNKQLLNNMDIERNCCKMAANYLGKDIELLNSSRNTRNFILNNFGDDGIKIFTDMSGNIKIDMEHCILLYYKLNSLNASNINKAIGLMYYVGAHQLNNEFKEILSCCINEKLEPKFELSSSLFRWRRCNNVLRKYMLQLSKPQGYKAYVFEIPGLAQIAYLISKGMTPDDAKDLVDGLTGGMFYTFLPPKVENILLSSILDGSFCGMDGIYAQTYERDQAKLKAAVEGANESNTIFSMMVKPYMIEFMGLAIKEVNEELLYTGHDLLSAHDFEFYHVSPYRVALLIKDNIKIEHYLPNKHVLFEQITNFTPKDLVFGYYL